MSSKDYYKVLEVNPTASTHDIKKSYRRLAHKYHPDKNSGHKVSEARFREIQEAYKVLSDDKKRQDYNYKRFDQHHGLHKKRHEPPVTAGMILQRSKDLRKRIGQMDPSRMNADALFIQLENLLSPSNLNLINAANSFTINKEVVENLLESAKPLNYKSSVKITRLLRHIGIDAMVDQKIQTFLRAQRMRSFWQKYQILVALIAAVLFCILIYVIST